MGGSHRIILVLRIVHPCTQIDVKITMLPMNYLYTVLPVLGKGTSLCHYYFFTDNKVWYFIPIFKGENLNEFSNSTFSRKKEGKNANL